MEDQEYTFLKSRIYRVTGIDLSSYKTQQMRRRLDGFINSYSITVPAYCRMLEQNPACLKKLQDFITINVSEFFRDPGQFAFLEKTVLPELLKGGAPLKIWSAACSNGQEPYSIAMMLEDANRLHHHRILATDIDEGALATAKNGGPYVPSDVRNVRPTFRDKYFSQGEDGFRVNEKIRSRVEFRKHNLLADRFETGFDIIICRNVIIYLSDVVRDELHRKFCQSLKEGGVLFVGGSEAILQAGAFGLANLAPSFYRRAPVKKEKILVADRS
jgi:chemotaxis protein methyltransferase CheR